MSLDTLRANMRQQMIGHGMAPDVASVATDLAFHAAEEARETLMRIAFSHPNQYMGLTALSASIGVLRHLLDVTEKATVSVAREAGATVLHRTVQG